MNNKKNYKVYIYTNKINNTNFNITILRIENGDAIKLSDFLHS